MSDQVLLGREAEIRAIAEVVATARAGSGAMLALLGEPGIGKTALLAHAANQATGLRLLSARPLEAERDLPYAALGDLIRPLDARVGELPAPQAEALRGVLALGPPVPAARYAVAAAFLNLLALEAGTGPVLLMIDDAQWLDDGSREALEFALHRLGQAPVAALVAARTGEDWGIDLPGATKVELAGLEPEPSLELLRGTAGSALADPVGRILAERTAGNPLALQEAVKALAENQLSGVEPLPPAPRPGHELGSYFARVADALPEGTRRALVVLAADDSREAAMVNMALADLGVGAGALDAAESAGIVTRSNGSVDFRHPLVRSAIYHHAAADERRAAHRALAAAFQDRPDAVLRHALHLAAATPAADDQVAATLERAAALTRAQGGPQASLAVHERAARLSVQPLMRARRLMEAGRDAVSAGLGDRATDLLAEALDHAAGDDGLRAEIHVLRGRRDVLAGDPQHAHDLMTAEAARIEDRHPEAAAALLLESAGVRMATGNIEGLIADASRARSLAAEDSAVAGVAGLVLAEGLAAAGRAAEGWPLIEASLPFLREPALWMEVPELVGMAGQAALWVERFDVAGELLVPMAGAAREAGALRALVYPLAVLGQLHHRSGSWPRARAEAAEAVELAREIGLAALLAFSLACLARIDATIGESEEATRGAAEAESIARRFGLGAVEQHVLAARGLLHLGASRFEDAAATLTALRRRDEREFRVGPGVLMWHADLTEALVRAGRPEEAAPVVKDLEARAEPGYGAWAFAAAARCRGLLAADQEFEASFAEALRLHDQAPPMPFERARTELCLGECLRRAGRRVHARGHLRSALGEFERLGARPWAERARGGLRASGERLRGPADSDAELTPQELRVALNVAGGASNNETAAALFLSPKTVEFHLSRVYRKLGIRSRAELARVLRD